MKYPRINKEKLDSINRKRFDKIRERVEEALIFNNQENELGLTVEDINLLGWNLATEIIVLV